LLVVLGLIRSISVGCYRTDILLRYSIIVGQFVTYLRKDGLPFAQAYFLSFIFLGPLARDDLVQPGEIIVGFLLGCHQICPSTRLIRLDPHLSDSATRQAMTYCSCHCACARDLSAASLAVDRKRRD